MLNMWSALTLIPTWKRTWESYIYYQMKNMKYDYTIKNEGLALNVPVGHGSLSCLEGWDYKQSQIHILKDQLQYKAYTLFDSITHTTHTITSANFNTHHHKNDRQKASTEMMVTVIFLHSEVISN